MKRALIFDYDGLIVDTETAEYHVWKEIYEAHGTTLKLSDWVKAVGWVDHFDPRSHLEKILGRSLDWTILDPQKQKRHFEVTLTQPMLPGVAELMERGSEAGYSIGIASNSNAAWVEPGLERLGLTRWIKAIRTRDRVQKPKPDPELYVKVLQDLGADPKESFAFEDSHPGVSSAKAAGLHVVSIPNPCTKHHDLSKADQILESLALFKLPI
jgi:HAD superfamily hydrolase (TIGR01509 family)